MDKNDEQIMLDYLSGKKEAIEMIYMRYKIPILNFSLKMLGNRADAEDVTHEVFLALVSHKYNYHPEAKFSTWLFTVARNSCISRIRKRKYTVSMWFQSKENDTYDQWQVADSQKLSDQELEQKEKAGHVKAAMSKLPLNQKEALILREYHAFSYNEISHILNCSLENVKILIFRAREQLRHELRSLIKENNHD